MDSRDITGSLSYIRKALSFEQDDGKTYICSIKRYSPKRSLNANAYAWVLIGKIADVLRANKDDIYETMLERYGQRYTLEAVPEADLTAYGVKHAHRHGRHGDKMEWIVYRGESEYNTHDMSIFLDGIVSEAQEMGIDTKTPAEIALLEEKWK